MKRTNEQKQIHTSHLEVVTVNMVNLGVKIHVTSCKIIQNSALISLWQQPELDEDLLQAPLTPETYINRYNAGIQFRYIKPQLQFQVDIASLKCMEMSLLLKTRYFINHAIICIVFDPFSGRIYF